MDRSSRASSSDEEASSPEPEPATRRGAPVAAPPPLWLSRLVEHELVPRLLDPTRAPVRRPAPADSPGAADVEVLVDLLLADDAQGCEDWTDALRTAGIDADRLCDALFAPAARRLGEHWDEDRCDFVQVSIALGRLQALVHRVGADADSATRGARRGRVLVATLPGRDHLLGAVIVAETFRRAGWDVTFEPGASGPDLLRAVRTTRFDLIGISVPQERDGTCVRALLDALRAASCNPAVTTMAGGPALRRRPALRRALGVDLVARDAREAVALGERALQGAADTPDARPAAAVDGAPIAPARRGRAAAPEQAGTRAG
jgi:methanogenic corrinoid protein MtbC1